MTESLQGMEPEIDNVVRTQVFLATHDGADKRLPLMNRSFISFSYGGKWIEDMPFVSVIDGDYMTGDLYGKFTDNTSTYDVIDGQFYWGTHFNALELTFKLATDEINDKQLNEFKYWFQPGPAKELILAEHPNRAIMARIAQPPKYNLQPFEKRFTRMINGQEYSTYTTIYRGDITLNFVADDPFWYARDNILPNMMQDANGEAKNTLDIEDYIKVIYEDEIPTYSMLQLSTVILGSNEHNVYTNPVVGSHLAGTDSSGTLHEPLVLRSSIIVTQPDDGSQGTTSPAALFYCGTAPAPTVLKFSFTPKLNNNTNSYIMYPLNDIHNKNTDNYGSMHPYNIITVGSQEFQFTTPGIYTGYNQALKIGYGVTAGQSVVDLKILMHEQINEYYSRSWALAVLTYLTAQGQGIDTSTQTITNVDTFKTKFVEYMKKFLVIDTTTDEQTQQTTDNIPAAAVVFNSKTGESTGEFKVRVINTSDYNAAFSLSSSATTNISDLMSISSFKSIKENVGDMVYGKYLYLTDRNYINENGTVTIDDCTKIYTDYEGGLNKFDLLYKNMYL